MAHLKLWITVNDYEETNSEQNDIALLVHDCIVYYTPKSIDELSRIVKEKTGFELEFSEVQY